MLCPPPAWRAFFIAQAAGICIWYYERAGREAGRKQAGRTEVYLLNELINASVLRNVRPGNQLKVRFRPDAIADTIFMADMHFRRELCLNNQALQFLEALNATRDWLGDANRTLVFTVGPEWDALEFMGQLGHTLEALEIVSQEAPAAHS